jgi:hypothetical protein
VSEKIYCRLRVKTFQEYILRNNISIRILSHKIGYDSGQMTNWLGGKRFVGPTARRRIQKYMKMEWDSLFEIISDSEMIAEGCG